MVNKYVTVPHLKLHLQIKESTKLFRLLNFTSMYLKKGIVFMLLRTFNGCMIHFY